MNQPLLSIAVPTFNRASKLQSLLEKLDNLISKELTENACKIEIIVSDNNSNDDTHVILSQFKNLQRSYSFHAFKNKTNIGSDRNFVKAIQRASGTFVWLLSDDDALEENAVSEIISSLQANSGVGFGFINYFLGSSKTSSAITPFNSPLVAENLEEYISKVWFADSFVSSIIVKKSLLTDEQLNANMGEGYPHLYWVTSIQLTHQSLIIRMPLITFHHPGVHESRQSSKSRESTRDFYLEAHLGFMRYTSYLKTLPLTIKLKSRIHRINLDENFNQIFYHKITSNHYDFISISHALYVMTKKFYYNPSFWLGQLPLLIGPAILAKLLEPLRWKWLNFRAQLKVVFLKLFRIG